MKTTSTHDVIVIGGSLAGAACVRELERLGIDAIAFERDRFPRPKVCGGFVSPGGVDCLEEMSLLPAVRRAGATEVRSARIVVDTAEVAIPFQRPGLGISRNTLDAAVAQGAAVREGTQVTAVVRAGSGFIVSGPNLEARCKVVVDAAGKLSRLTRRKVVDEFGIQFVDEGTRPGVLDFWFFEGGYGGGVAVEGGRANYCFLINKDKLAGYLTRPGRLVTGPLAYDRVPGEFIAIGDAAGMVDPFCGEGMHHALDTGIIAARVIARGLGFRRSYDEMRNEYEREWRRRWGQKRAVGAALRRLLRNRPLLIRALRTKPECFLDWMWRSRDTVIPSS